jgi:hypothetical protein
MTAAAPPASQPDLLAALPNAAPTARTTPALPPSRPTPESAHVTAKAAPQSPSPAASANAQSLSCLIWSVTDLLRDNYRQHEYGKVILPFTALRSLDGVHLNWKER